MNSKLFVFLVVLLSILIICAFIALGFSIVKYNQLTPPVEASSTIILNGDVEKEDVDSIPENERVLEIAHDESLYILPSNTREITLDDIKDMSKEELNRAYNELYARYGHDFESQSWYKAVPGKIVTTAELTALENKNLDTIYNRIKEIEKK